MKKHKTNLLFKTLGHPVCVSQSSACNPASKSSNKFDIWQTLQGHAVAKVTLCVLCVIYQTETFLGKTNCAVWHVFGVCTLQQPAGRGSHKSFYPSYGNAETHLSDNHRSAKPFINSLFLLLDAMIEFVVCFSVCCAAVTCLKVGMTTSSLHLIMYVCY